MVATKLSEVAGKGWGWYNSSAGGSTTTTDATAASPSRSVAKSDVSTPTTSSSTSTSIRHNNSNPLQSQGSSRKNRSFQEDEEDESLSSKSSPSKKYWEDAVGTVEQTYSNMAGYVPAIGWSLSPRGGGGSESSDDDSDDNEKNHHPTRGDPVVMENMPTTPRENQHRRSSILTSPTVLNLFHNPYVTVRGHQSHLPVSSMEAIRSLINTVPASTTAGGGEGTDHASSEASSSSILAANNNGSSIDTEGNRLGVLPSIQLLTEPRRFQPSLLPTPQQHSSTSETASQLAEGTLRAFRDIALDEAVELHEALRYWSSRWERPLLSWLEAGPLVWFSEEGYQHQKVGQKVSQIQAVLARRCATIGELQSHLLRAGWQRGVAQWGVLGGEWATVAGNDGRMGEASGNNNIDAERLPPSLPAPKPYSFRRITSDMIDNMPAPPTRTELPRKAPSSNISELPQQARHNSLYYTNVFVKNNDGGHIIIDDPALAEWSVDAISLVRRQLYRAANGQVTLPYSENWAEADDEGSHTGAADSTRTTIGKLPLWASLRMTPASDDSFSDSLPPPPENVPSGDDTDQARVQVSDLPLLVNEVSELLDIMESVIHIQRSRRLEKLKPMSWLQRNWYLGALSLPPLAYFAIRGAKSGYGLNLIKSIQKHIAQFFREHVVDPLYAMYDEFTKGTVDISDRQARDVAVENLQKMIRSWLDETHPDMPVKQRRRMAKRMDISLIEVEKEESMKTIYNINSVIRMSFIEAQFLKKELMNALLAMDEMRASTNFNMNMAAVTPFVLAVWVLQKTFKFVYYAILKVGKSREETYGSFFRLLTEIERLLVMRDSPPAPLPSSRDQHDGTSQNQILSDCLLNADDLGMLMLHIHELRTVLWQDRRRFSTNIVRNVAEDLAELAGERGAVSVRQQLQIIWRIGRTYPFLRAVDDRMFDFQYR